MNHLGAAAERQCVDMTEKPVNHGGSVNCHRMSHDQRANATRGRPVARRGAAGEPRGAPEESNARKDRSRRLTSLLSVTHLIGLALGVGAATVKLTLLLRCNADYAFVPVYVDVVEPKFQRLAPAAGEPAPAEFIRIQAQYLTLEVTATALFYVIILMWVLV